jgi:GNAT superfamily N-acetyltransferase
LGKAQQSYQSGLKVHVIDSAPEKGTPEYAYMEKMYALYKKTFPVPGETQPLEDLIGLLADNSNPDVQNSPPRSRESWILLEDPQGNIVGAFNTLALSTSQADETIRKEADGTHHLIYTFVDPSARAMGLSDMMMNLSLDDARQFFADTHAMHRGDRRKADDMTVAQFAEQNNFKLMDIITILVDTIGAKIHQLFRRDLFQNKWGFGEFAANYVQPGLSGEDPVECLNMIGRVIPAPSSGKAVEKTPSMSAELYLFHAAGFFTKSCGVEDVEKDPVFVKQREELMDPAKDGKVGLIHDIDYMGMHEKAWAKIKEFVSGGRFKAKDLEENVSELLGIGQKELKQGIGSPAIVARPAASTP